MSDITSPNLPQRMRDKIIVDENGCWNWTSSLDNDGYGRVWFEGGTRQAHRVVYALLAGHLDDKLDIDHLCRNHSCVHPEHLEPVTPLVNSLRGYSPAAMNRLKETCPRGHAYDAIRKQDGKSPSRICSTCWGGGTADGSKPTPKAELTHCANRHEYTPENTRVSNGSRHCRACARDTYHRNKPATVQSHAARKQAV